MPKELEGVGVTEHLGERIPLDLEFVDSDGKPVALKQFFDGKRPVMLTLNYSNCPMLCSLQLNGLFDAMKRMPWDIGDKFEMVTVSFDPLETPERARMTKQKYLEIYRRAGAAEGWHFLTGREENIKKLADAVGFRYRYSPRPTTIHSCGRHVHSHAGRPRVAILVRRRVRSADPATVLLEAADGKIGSTTDQILLFCFHYDAESGRYGPAAFRLMQMGGGLTVLMVGGVIWILRRREKAKNQQSRTFDRLRNCPCSTVARCPILAAAGLPLAQTSGFWLPDSAAADPVTDRVFNLILVICSLLFLLVVGLMVLFVVRYRRRPGRLPQKSPAHNTLLETTWTVIPVLIVSVIFYQGFIAYMKMQTAPPGCYDLRVSARQWAWQFIYPNGYVDEESARAGRRAGAADHDFRRRDPRPVDTRAAGEAGRGARPIFERVVSGRQRGNVRPALHAILRRRPFQHAVQARGADARGLRRMAERRREYLKTLPPAEAGKMLYQRRGCSQCHSIDGTAGTGPSFKGIYGKTVNADRRPRPSSSTTTTSASRSSNRRRKSSPAISR